MARIVGGLLGGSVGQEAVNANSGARGLGSLADELGHRKIQDSQTER
jgi:hypothetical protein